MKNIIVYILLLTSITSSAQNDAAEDTITKPAITAIGKPDGEKTEMKIEEKYRNQLKNLRDNIDLLSNYSIDSAENKNRNQINRNRILITLFNDWKSSDYEIVDFLFNEEKKLRKKNKKLQTKPWIQRTKRRIC